MIKFFRKIRQNLLSQGKTGKYFKYAIGEIILVVIGILIALQINTWNDQKKIRGKTSHLFKEVQKELLYNINQSNIVIDFYRKSDSLLYKVIHKKVTYDDYKTSYDLRTLITSNEPADLVSEAFNNLIDNDGSLTQQENSIILKLKKLFGTRKKLVDEWDNITSSDVNKFMEKLKNEKEWYSKLMEISDEQIDYFLNDPFYLNEVKHFEIQALQTHMYSIVNFRSDALDIYEELSDYLDLKMNSSIVKNLIDYNHYFGTFEYDSQHNGHIRRDNNRLKLDFMAKNDTIVVFSLPLVPESKTYFTTGHLFGKFIFDENNNVSSIILSNGSQKEEHKKINK